nr:ATP-binding protein [Micromonospora sp. DSM 115978]
HRILQESITNVIRHADATTASVVLRYSPGALTVEVTDDGRGSDGTRGDTSGDRVGSGDGFGIRGMRERAVAVGGCLDAGPGPAGGFRVTARLPTDRR